MRAPIGPGNGARSKPARVCLQRAHVTSGAGVLHLRESEQLQETDVQPADVELVPLRLELRGLGIGVVIVVQLFAAQPDCDWSDVPTLVLHLEIAIAEGMADAVHDAGGPEWDPQHLNAPDDGTNEETEEIDIDAEHDQDADPV